MKIAIQGELGSFSHEAASLFAPQSEVLPCNMAEQVLQALSEGRCDAAAIPVENSLAGSVIDFYNLFFEHDFTVVGELQLRIRHNLIGPAGATKFETVRRAFSHPVALAQCKQFFAENPQIEPAPFYDTAGSVQHVVEAGNPEWAGIASRRAAAEYGANLLRENIEDHKESYTRFWLIRRPDEDEAQDAPTKMSLVFLLENRPGALLAALSAFATRNLNLTKIESRPVTIRPWEYMFFADVTIQGHNEADAVVKDLKSICTTVKELGRYAVANPASN